jgi:tripeptide aminopeptidase
MNYKLTHTISKAELLDRFISYVKTYSSSSEASADKGNAPSTPQQALFAEQLKKEMAGIGISSVTLADHSFLYGYLPASEGQEAVPAFCMMADIDTTEEVCGKNVVPQIIEKYNGRKIELKESVILDPEKDKALAQAGEEKDTIITTDGTTLLGADDKAGIAEIMTAAAYLLSHPEIKHGKIELLFSPDEETGHGMDFVPLALLTSKRCYTVDGGHIGELETECFNAVKTEVFFTGISVHTGTARSGGLVSAIAMASAFITSLPYRQLPETTDGYEGFYAPLEIQGTLESARVHLLLRDFTQSGMEKRKDFINQLAQITAAAFGGKSQVVHTKQYLNMKEKLDAHPSVVNNLVKAYKKCGIEPDIVPIRGGTDGSRLTEMGIPTPNMFTGGHNYHSRSEWASLSQMTAACDILVALAETTAEE